MKSVFRVSEGNRSKDRNYPTDWRSSIHCKAKKKTRAKIMLINKKNAAGIQPEENEIIQQARRTSSCRVSFSGIKKIVRAEILGKGYNIYK